MASAIQIRRRNSGAAGAPADIKAGELAYNHVDDVLYYGAGDDGAGNATLAIPIGGPGVYAKLNNPAFTGVPSAPTAATGTRTTQIATTGFVASAVDALVAGAPGALNTLKELADAINDDASFAATLTAAIGLKAPIASPALTGTPTATTALADDNSLRIATTAWLLGQLSSAVPNMNGAGSGGTSLRVSRSDHVHPTDTSRAPVTSPSFGGVPTAPTAAAGTNTTQLATTAFVAAALAALIGTAPGALDTLGELSDALNDDANFAATVTNSLALKAPVASPGFTGTPTAPTPTSSDNSTRLATTAFVVAALGSVTGTTAIDGGTF